MGMSSQWLHFLASASILIMWLWFIALMPDFDGHFEGEV